MAARTPAILFVCLGNICRSSLAEGLARHLAAQREIPVHIDSAGTSRYHNGEPPCPLSIELARQHGFDISHQRSEHLSAYDLSVYDRIIAMDRSNYCDLKALGFSNIAMLGDYGFDGQNVADLYYEPQKADEVYHMIETACEAILSEFAKPPQ